MSQFLWKLLLASPAVLCSSGLLAASAVAADFPTSQTGASVLESASLEKQSAELIPDSTAPQLLAENTQATIAVQPAPVQPAVQPAPIAPVTVQSQQPLLAQSVRSVRSTPSVSQLEADPLQAPPLPAQPVASTRSLGQVTSVSQLSDVQPTDWAFQALQSLVERYGCIAGYPDGTFRGNRAATRYEMAAALNACLDVISDRFATKEDLAALRKLMEEFAAELATIKGRVNNLEARTAQLEAQQFSTTTKLRATAVFSFSDGLIGQRVFPSRPDGAPDFLRVRGGPGSDLNDNPIVTYRVRLNLDTSFTGKDLLRTRLQAGNVPSYAAFLSNSARLAYDVPGVGVFGGATANLFTLDKLFYRFPIFDKGTLQADAIRGEFNDNVYTFNPLFESSDRGALSRFGRFNPIYRLGGDAGLTFNYPVIQRDKRNVLVFSASYLGGQTAVAGTSCGATPSPACYSAGNPNNPFRGGSGLFNGPFGALAQLEWAPLKDLRLGFTYVRTYGLDISGGTGTTFAANPFGTPINGRVDSGIRDNSANNFGFQFTWRAIPKLTVSGWAGYSQVFGVTGPAGRADARADVLNWGLTLGVPDLWRKGDMFGVVFGQTPTVITNNIRSGNFERVDADTPYIVEGQYRFQVNPNISVTPGVIAVFNANGNDQNDTVLLGVIRTTFTF